MTTPILTHQTSNRSASTKAAKRAAATTGYKRVMDWLDDARVTTMPNAGLIGSGIVFQTEVAGRDWDWDLGYYRVPPIYRVYIIPEPVTLPAEVR